MAHLLFLVLLGCRPGPGVTPSARPSVGGAPGRTASSPLTSPTISRVSVRLDSEEGTDLDRTRIRSPDVGSVPIVDGRADLEVPHRPGASLPIDVGGLGRVWLPLRAGDNGVLLMSDPCCGLRFFERIEPAAVVSCVQTRSECPPPLQTPTPALAVDPVCRDRIPCARAPTVRFEGVGITVQTDLGGAFAMGAGAEPISMPQNRLVEITIDGGEPEHLGLEAGGSYVVTVAQRGVTSVQRVD